MPESNTTLKQSKTLYYVTPSEYTNFTGISSSPNVKGALQHFLTAKKILVICRQCCYEHASQIFIRCM